MAKKVLIVFAHQSSGSFNAAAKSAAVEVLAAQGCTVEVSDLYAMNFKAAATAEDIKGMLACDRNLDSTPALSDHVSVTGDVKDAEHFRYQEETRLAWEEGRLAEDITAEQTKLSEADLVIFQFPMYWFSVPAIMKGWIDRVLTCGFAFTKEKRYSQGLLKEKKAMLSFTTGSLESMFSSTGMNGDMNVTLWPIQNGILHYCGFQVLPPQVFWAPSCASPEARTAMLEGWRSRLQGLLEEKPLSFISLDCFDPKSFQLTPDVQEKHASQEFGLTVGIHLGKPLPPQNQMKAGC
uniref:Flavodoxin-like fold domain-containing protein n=1 Tax=Oryzias latipes TaxID=8090 RepID=A0A3B3I0H8_ORYLA